MRKETLIRLWLFAPWFPLAAVEPDFATEVLPILSDKCFVCHGPDADKDEVRLDTYEGAIEDLGGYQAIDPSNPEKSEALIRIHDSKDPMPPDDAEKQLTEAERELLSRWIKAGGKYSKHWAYVRPEKTEGGDIDELITKKHAEKGLDFAKEAERSTLARRVGLTLTGLPPEPAQVEKFLSGGDYETLVDELISSSRFGEHQARYWLDAVRYGDTHGLHLDNRRGIFPYRDWVVKAFNDNLPINDFITWQVAGDLLENPSLEQQVATGYIRMNPTTSEGGAIAAEFQAKNNFDRTENFGTVFLGMSMNCARCHTHKYDPITHQEYFQLFAFFNSTSESPLDGNKYDYAPTVKAPASAEAWKLWDQLQAKKSAAVGNAEELLKLEAEETELRKNFITTLVAKDRKKPRETKILHRGEYSEPIGEPLQPDVFEFLNPFPENAPRNRLGLARWLTSRDNPLTTRVLVNRFWQSVFGEGLVRSPEDFGVQGKQPTHPQLLDQLSVEFQESGWDYKKLIKRFVMSRTFKQDSTHRYDFPDEENLWLARGPSYRLDAEVIRDLGLWAGGLLNEEMGGPGVKPFQPGGMWAALSHPASNTKKYVQDTGDKIYRRSLYVYWKRTSPHPMMTLFDAPSRESSCVRRSRGNTPLQSLGLLNEPQRVEMARAVSAKVSSSEESDLERLNQIFVRLTCRKASESEAKVCLNLLNAARDRYRDDPESARKLTGSEEGTVDQAAWAQVTGVILASDINILLY